MSLIHSSTWIIIEALLKNCNISSIKSKVSLYITLEELHSIYNSDVTASRTRNKIYQHKTLADAQSLSTYRLDLNIAPYIFIVQSGRKTCHGLWMRRQTLPPAHRSLPFKMTRRHIKSPTTNHHQSPVDLIAAYPFRGTTVSTPLAILSTAE